MKVDDGAEANLLPLCSFRSMFPHTLDGDGYPLEGFLDDSRTELECYNDGKLVNHGSITLKLKHYSNGSFQDHQFFIVETPAHREIIIGHPVSVRLGLIKVLCQNIAQPVTAKEAKSSNLTKITNIDGKVPHRQPSAADLSTTAVQVDRKDANLTPFKTLIQDLHIEMGIENTKRVPFKTPFQDPYAYV